MKIKENITLYVCDFCGKEYKRKHFCIKHEVRCKKNPTNHRACFGCQYLTMEEFEFETFIGLSNSKHLFFCTKQDHFLIPPLAKHKGNVIDTGDNEDMPVKCKDKQKFLSF